MISGATDVFVRADVEGTGEYAPGQVVHVASDQTCTVRLDAGGQPSAGVPQARIRVRMAVGTRVRADWWVCADNAMRSLARAPTPALLQAPHTH